MKVLNLAKRSQLSAGFDQGLDFYRSLYHKLLNLEQHSDILPLARKALMSLLMESVEYQTKGDIYDLDTYTPEELQKFIDTEHESTLDQWEEYLSLRALGSGPTLFTTRAEAESWLKTHAPNKYVDGAWLGHIHRITTPFNLRGVTRDAWQVLSEELGDGDLAKNHVHLYRATLAEIGINLPPGDSPAFIEPGHGMDDVAVWKGAVAQLLISLFPNEFLPEILGFNMHFEQLTLTTLKAAKELPLFGISGYYFILHIAVDNADSGHTAMAVQTIRDYMDLVSNSAGPAAAAQTWKRIQAGYQLSRMVGSDYKPGLVSPAIDKAAPEALRENESRLLKILDNKARVSQRIHCASRVKIGNRTLVDWLSRDLWGSVQMQRELLLGLSQARPWVRPGDSTNSLLVRELSWKGRMFGAFTQAEIEVVKQWIDSLGNNTRPNEEVRYWQWVGCNPPNVENRDITLDYPVFAGPSDLASEVLDWKIGTPVPSGAFEVGAPLCLTVDMNFVDLLHLWFSHQCLLEGTVAAPFRTTTPLAARIVSTLRAGYGFGPESCGVTGINQDKEQASRSSLVDLGLEMFQRYYDCIGDTMAIAQSPPSCLRDVMELTSEHRDSGSKAFALAMLHWSMHPVANMGLLVGLARAFVDLEIWVAQAADLLSVPSRRILERIVERKISHLDFCRGELEKDEKMAEEFRRGYTLGRSTIEYCMRPRF